MDRFVKKHIKFISIMQHPAMASCNNSHSNEKRKKWKKFKRSSKYSRVIEDVSGSSSSYSNFQEENAADLDIPGFYYDKEKKKYFKILPGQNHPHSSSFVTKESIQVKHNEDARQKDLKLLHEGNLMGSHMTQQLNAQLSSHQSFCSRKKKIVNYGNILELFSDTSMGILSPLNLRTRISKISSVCLKPLAWCKVFDFPSNSYENLEHMQKMIPSTKAPSNMICMWSLKQLLVQRIQTLSVTSFEQHQENRFKMKVNVTGAMIPKTVSKVTSMCCAPMKSQGMEEYVLYTTMCLIGNNSSLVMLRNLNCTDASDFRFSEFNLSSKATWCCAWSSGKECFSVGTERCGLLVDVQSRSLWELHTENSDVLSQHFSPCGTMLYSGTRHGSILGHDLRSRSTFHTAKLRHKAAVCSLKLLSNDHHLIVSDFNHQIRMWDLRQRKIVMDYKGHKNEHSIIPLHIDEDLSLVYSAGQDCYSRLWDLKSGELLKAVPPPHPASITSIPCLHYSCSVGKRPGLLMGIQDEVHFYSM